MPVSISVDKGTGQATVTVSIGASAILASTDDAKGRNMAILAAASLECRKAVEAVAFESEANIDADLAERLAKEEARAVELKAALPTTDVESKAAK